MDSGAALHIVNKSLLTNEELRTVRKRTPAVKLQTANGIATATHQAKVKVMELDIDIVGNNLSGFALPHFDGEVMSRMWLHF